MVRESRPPGRLLGRGGGPSVAPAGTEAGSPPNGTLGFPFPVIIFTGLRWTFARGFAIHIRGNLEPGDREFRVRRFLNNGLPRDAMLNQHVLVLNRYWVAVHVCTARRAVDARCSRSWPAS